MRTGHIVDDRGTKHWYLNGKHHRDDGPAIESANGTKHWYLNGRRHRINGPAYDRADGTKEWWINGQQLDIIPQEVLFNYMKANNLTPAHLLTDPDPVVRKSAEKYESEKIK
jgi:hypothetical protein